MYFRVNFFDCLIWPNGLVCFDSGSYLIKSIVFPQKNALWMCVHAYNTMWCLLLYLPFTLSAPLSHQFDVCMCRIRVPMSLVRLHSRTTSVYICSVMSFNASFAQTEIGFRATTEAHTLGHDKAIGFYCHSTILCGTIKCGFNKSQHHKRRSISRSGKCVSSYLIFMLLRDLCRKNLTRNRFEAFIKKPIWMQAASIKLSWPIWSYSVGVDQVILNVQHACVRSAPFQWCERSETRLRCRCRAVRTFINMYTHSDSIRRLEIK